jgi:hypothetical protein
MNPLNPFAESPRVVTVALNPALDQTIEIAGLRPGAVNRALRMQVDVGGKAVNVASCLSDFGVNAAVTGQIGRDNAALFEELFQRKKIANHCCYLDGLTRINSKLVDTVSGETTDLNMPGPEFDSGRRDRVAGAGAATPRFAGRARALDRAVRQPAAGDAGGRLRHHHPRVQAAGGRVSCWTPAARRLRGGAGGRSQDRQAEPARTGRTGRPAARHPGIPGRHRAGVVDTPRPRPIWSWCRWAATARCSSLASRRCSALPARVNGEQHRRRRRRHGGRPGRRPTWKGCRWPTPPGWRPPSPPPS